ncbi:hypothetical protein BESB_030660 [Besnoitia besnoiti]|uniref:Glucose-methanol-choline oxidoreductase C-terminal domain-containing protein n=1 Tax=Besnoitia besnoiti TaxID=94643 RepID=A0A2A9M735_BESBE|nr:hypothetical protein BESB_030660 [Besnoitia besnoiti]PFH31192.1 hypothetical protein BESB_030660 [Besnoitia besnoiti]
MRISVRPDTASSWLLGKIVVVLLVGGGVRAQPWGVTQDVNIVPNVFEKNAPTAKAVVDLPEKYDYIVVGCGAAGCPIAGYLANQGHRVLLLERGRLRSHENTPHAMDMYGAGMGIADPSISQTIATRNGVRTHVGAVMGGGTSISLGIYIEEPWSFFDYLNRAYNAGWEESLLRKAHTEVKNIFGDDERQYVTPNDTPFGTAVGGALRRQGYEPLGGRLPAQRSPTLKMGYQWNAYSQFSNKDGFRMTSDFFISKGYVKKEFRKHLTVREGNFVEHVEWDRDANGPIARCVIYHKTRQKDTKGVGLVVQVPPASSSARFGEWVGTLFDATSAVVDASDFLPGATLQPTDRTIWRRACIRDNDANRIIISAGAIQSVTLLYRSGVGPLPQLRQSRVRPVLEVPTLGQEFIDRAFVTLNFFQKHFADKIEPIPKAPLGMMDTADRGYPLGWDHPSDVRDFQGLSPRGNVSSRSKQANHGSAGNRLSDASDPASEFGNSKFPSLGRRVDSTSHTDDYSTNTKTDKVKSSRTGTSRAINFIFPAPDEPVAPQLTGGLKDPLFPWFGELEPPRLCQATGIRLLGPTCPRNPNELTPPAPAEPFLLQSTSLSCSAVPIGHVSGGRVAEGVIYATRFILPPLLRNDPAADAIFETLQACSEHRDPFGLTLLKPLCAIAYPIIKCFRKVYANFYYTAQPKSRGSVRVKEDGQLDVNSNHLQHEADIFDAVRGVATLLNIANQDTYRKVVQDAQVFSCPATILNGFLDILTTLGSTSAVFMTKPTNFYLMQNHLQDLVPPQHRRLRRIVKLGEGVRPRKLQALDVDGELQEEGPGTACEFEDYSPHIVEDLDLEKMAAVGIKSHLKDIGFDFESYVSHLEGRSQEACNTARSSVFLSSSRHQGTENFFSTNTAGTPFSSETSTRLLRSKAEKAEGIDQLAEAVEACKMGCPRLTDRIFDGFCPAADVCCTVFGNSKCTTTPDEKKQLVEGLLQSGADSTHTIDRSPGTPLQRSFGQPSTGEQWAATFPPLLPRPQDPKAVAKYALTYMSSIWHHANTVPMGKAVDNNFDLIGARRLSVIDSSVLNELPRMNPSATVMLLGIYGGMVKQRQRMLS